MAMDEKLSNIVGELVDGISTMTTSETIVGEPQQAGDAVIIPVHRLKLAFGVASTKAGAHHNESGGDWGGEGAGGAIEVDPVAAIAIGKDGRTRVLTVDADDAGATWSGLIKEVPDLLRKVAVAIGDRATSKLAASQTKAIQSAPEATDGVEDADEAPELEPAKALPQKSKAKKEK